MKKLTAILLTALMVFAFAACGSVSESSAKREENPVIAELFDKGFMITMSSCDETHWAGIFAKEGSFDELYKAEAPMTSELYAEFDAIDWEDEKGKNNFIRTLSDATVTDVSDLVPAQEELDAYIGKTLQELEDEGFERSGNITTDEGTMFYYDGPVYCVLITTAETVASLDDYSENDLRALTVGKVEFLSMSNGILDE